MCDITSLLLQNRDEEYCKFSKKLIPDTRYPIIGVRVPIIKKIAKDIIKNSDKIFEFINHKHTYYEEFFLHGLLLNNISKDIHETLKYIDEFLPCVDNWAICDSAVAALKICKNNRNLILEKVKIWIKSSHPFAVRFAIVILLNYFLEKNFDRSFLSLVKSAYCNHYYVNMAIAWFFSVALIKNYDDTITLFEEKSMPKFIQNKSIQKAKESFRIPEFKKTYLNTLKI